MSFLSFCWRWVNIPTKTRRDHCLKTSPMSRWLEHFRSLSSRLFLPDTRPFCSSSIPRPFPSAKASLPHWRAFIINSVRLDVKGARGRDSPAEVTAVCSEETKQLLAVIPERSHHLSCTKVAYSSPSSLFSPRLGDPIAFHLGAVTQGLCHLSCFLQIVVSQAGAWSNAKHEM